MILYHVIYYIRLYCFLYKHCKFCILNSISFRPALKYKCKVKILDTGRMNGNLMSSENAWQCFEKFCHKSNVKKSSNLTLERTGLFYNCKVFPSAHEAWMRYIYSLTQKSPPVTYTAHIQPPSHTHK